MDIRLQDLQNLLPVQLLVLSNLGIQVLLFLCAGARWRETSSGRVSDVRLTLLWIAYNFGDTVATYTLTRLSFFSTEGNHPLVELWVPFVLLHLAGPDNIAAYALQDNELSFRSLQPLLSQIIAGAYFIYTYRNIGGHFIRLASRLMFVVGVVKYSERWLALDRGRLDSIRDSLKMQPAAINYIHSHREDAKLKLEGGLETLDEESRLRRAHSLFNICKSGMVGSSDDVPRKQNFMGNMVNVEWWAIVEIELSLMYDILYTKAAVIHTWHGYTICVISPLAILTSLLLFHFHQEDGHRKVDIPVPFDTATTYVLFVGALLMELTSLLNTLGSSWMFATLSTTRRTWLRYTFLCSGRWDRLRRFVLSLNSLVTCGHSSRSGARRWCGHMGQYNMMHFCTRPNSLLTRPLLGRLAKLVGLVELWIRNHFPGATKVSEQIRFCIAKHAEMLYTEGGLNTLGMIELKWGMTTLQHHQVVDQFEVTLGREFQEGIIIWHIGTDFFLSKCSTANADSRLVKSIKALSNYMMFLLVQRPAVLPIIVKNKLYERACELLEGTSYRPKGICATLKSLFSWSDEPGAGNTSRAANSKIHAKKMYDEYAGRHPIYTLKTDPLTYSATVAKQLLRYEEKHGTNMALELVLEMWTDMLVYASNRSSRRDLDADKLSSGGELTTFVWLMVEHFHQASLEYRASVEASSTEELIS